MRGPYTIEEDTILFNGNRRMSYPGWMSSQIEHLCDMCNVAYFEGVKQCQENLEDPSGDYAPEWYSGMNTTT